MTAATSPTKSEPKPGPSSLPPVSEPDKDLEEGEQVAIAGEDLSEKRFPRLASPFFNLASPDPWSQFPFRQ